MFNTLKILKTMKIKKLFAIAALLLGSTSAFAADPTQEYTYEGLVYTLLKSGDKFTATVKKVSDDATYKTKATWEIPEKFTALKANGATDDFKDKECTVVGIAESAFAGNTNITSVTFAKSENITTIDASAFEGCTALTELTIGKNIKKLGNAFIKGTAITSLDLSVIETAKDDLDMGDANIFESANLEEIIFASFKADGSLDKSFKGVSLPATAFQGCLKLKKIVLPAGLTELPEAIFKYTKLETLDLSYMEALTTVNNIFTASNAAPFASLTTVKLPTKPAATLSFAESAFAYCTGLTTLNIPAGWAPTAVIFAAKSLIGAGVTEINFTPTLTAGAWAGTASIFAQTAFATEETLPTITFNTIREYVDKAGAAPYKVKYEYSKFDTKEITLNGNYALLKQKKGFRVSVDKAIVYSMYVDGTDDDGTIYMVPFKPVKGEYTVANGKAVLVKAKEKNANGKLDITVDATAETKEWTVSALQRSSDDADQLIVDLATGGNYVNVAAIKDGVFGIGSPAENYLAPKTYYVLSKKQYGAAGARIVWLDEDGATAIKTIKAKAANNGAIYNLAGQKVNAAYKGVVIKDGKKYIQK